MVLIVLVFETNVWPANGLSVLCDGFARTLRQVTRDTVPRASKRGRLM